MGAAEHGQGIQPVGHILRRNQGDEGEGGPDHEALAVRSACRRFPRLAGRRSEPPRSDGQGEGLRSQNTSRQGSQRLNDLETVRQDQHSSEADRNESRREDQEPRTSLLVWHLAKPHR